MSADDHEDRRGISGVLLRLLDWQIRRPWSVLLVALALTIPAALLARRLELRTGFESLLPENKPSVVELRRVGERTAGVATLSIVLVGDDKLALQRFGDALVPKLRALGDRWVGSAEDGVQAEQDFLRKRRALFVDLGKLKVLHERLADRYDYEIHGSLTGDIPEPISRASVERDLGIPASESRSDGTPPYPDGYYMNAAGTELVVLVRTPISPGDLDGIAALRKRVEGVVAELSPTTNGVRRVDYTGDVVTSAEQYGAVKNDLATVGAIGVGMILLVDFLFFLRIRAVASMAIAIGIGVIWTFGVTKVAVGHLNAASGFLVSIVFGNGLNNGIMLRARYGEARREGLDLRGALTVACLQTWRPTLTAALAGSAGYLALATTTFRGFRHFGAIGAYGMLLCWLANFLCLAPLLVIFEGWAPSYRSPKPGATGALRRALSNGLPFGAPFAALVRRAPRLLTIVGVVAGIFGAVVSVRYVRRDPIEYDTERLGNAAPGSVSPAAKLSEEVDRVVGRSGQDGMAIMTDRLDQVPPLVAELNARRDAAPPDRKPFSRVVSIFDLIPTEQAEKLQLLLEMRHRIDRIRALGKLTASDWSEIEPWLPPADLRPFGVADLPERVARPFTERDNTRGRIVYVVPADGRSVRDVRYLLLWADSFRATRLPTGETIIGSGRAVIFADILASVIEEAPRAIGLSLLAVVLVVAISFRRGKDALLSITLVLLALALGLVGQGAAMSIGAQKINFLNFIAVPITIGVGVDYAINIVDRWRLGGPKEQMISRVVRESGGAVVLCSLTTSLGYLALRSSVNGAVRSFGVAAVIGEVACVCAALLVLPGALVWIDSLRRPDR